MGSATLASYLGCKPFGGPGQPFPQLDLGLPPEPGTSEGDVGAALGRVVLGQGLVENLRTRPSDFLDQFGQLADRELVRVPDVDRADEVRVEQGEEAADLVSDVAEAARL